MKVLSIAAGLALAAGPFAPSHATSVSFGKPMMNNCYEHADMGRHDGPAFMHCEEALRGEMLSGDERAATLVNRGILWILDGNLLRARQDFDAALIIDSTQPEAWLGKGIVEFRIGNGDAAFQPLDRAIELRPRRPAVAYYVRGLANEEQGRVRAAYADLRMARQLDPDWQVPAKELERYRIVRR